MIDIQTETIVSISEARQHVPGQPSVPTLWRWVLSGTRAGKLESVLIGGRRYTSIEAIQRFAHQSTAGADGKAVTTQTAAQRKLAIQQAEAACDRDGI
jgi:hypothetical protein